MKKLLIFLMLIPGMLTSLLAQVDHDYSANDREAVVNETITKDQVPAAVLKAVNIRFDKNNPLTWSRFPYELKEYGWVYDINTKKQPVNHYQVTMKTATGDNFWAIYDAAGNLIQTREVSKNISLPAYVTDALGKSQYKDWKVLTDKEIIKYYHSQDGTDVEQHLRLTLEKNNVKKAVSFNYRASK